MTLFESEARALLVAHAVLGAAVVAVTTHLAWWTFRLVRGDPGRAAGIRWFSAVGAALYLAQFLLGNVLYPTYKVRVRAEYLDAPAAVSEDARARRARALGEAPPDAPVRRLEGVARTFDIKEHAVAVGLGLVVAAFLLGRRLPPERAARRLLLVCAVGAAACAWFGGLVGLWVTTFRSVGSL